MLLNLVDIANFFSIILCLLVIYKKEDLFKNSRTIIQKNFDFLESSYYVLFCSVLINTFCVFFGKSWVVCLSVAVYSFIVVYNLELGLKEKRKWMN